MSRRASSFLVALPELSRGPRERGLYQALREAILDGRLRSGARLPSTRELARGASVARGTAVAVYEQLAAEGYLEARRGSGSFVASALPDDLLRRGAGAAPPRRAPEVPALAERARSLAASPFPDAPPAPGCAFAAHQPALDVFPAKVWASVAASRMRRLRLHRLGDSSPLGDPPLRRALAEYLGAERGVRCEPEQIAVVTGTQQALDLVARLLLDPGDGAWVEDPGYPAARALLSAAGARLHPVPVDDDGLVVEAGIAAAPAARLAHVTPAHQAPLGVVLSAARRLALLEWARRARAWIFEDDYDSEFRYAGRPLPALQQLDGGGRVLHAGSFSKTLFPALRLGYLVVPPALVDAVARARSLIDRFPSILPQAVLCDFIADGHYARHLRRMRQIYAERRAALCADVAARLDGRLRLSAEPAGLDVVGWLPAELDERRVVAAASERQLVVEPLGGHAARRRLPPGVVLGFGAVTPRRIAAGVERLGDAIRAASPRR